VHRRIETEFCVVGGGLAGVCAALAAAREGARGVLVQDRPVLGGNSSSECRVHVGGADRSGKRKDARETGLIEELQLENLRRNPQHAWPVWDAVLYDKVVSEPNLTLLLNTSVTDATMDGDRIASVRAWQLTTETWLTVEGGLFADCSGDGILAPLTGAEYRMGREARAEHGESAAPEKADEHTMGMSCLFGARDMGRPVPFDPPDWAYDFPTDESFGIGRRGHGWLEAGYWWVELGGDRHSIHDTEDVRHELLRIVFGIWDHIKNHGDHGADNWALDFLQFLPAKRESRRLLGDHILTQNDIQSGGRFPDTVAYGGWPMDLHPPGGFWAKDEPPNINHPVPELYGIPYRCLYSRNIGNLYFAGRNISATHVACGSTRVMGTCAVVGQAVGTAAALAVRDGLSPRAVGEVRLDELQQTLLQRDAFLPRIVQRPSEATRTAALTSSRGDPEPLRDGVTRPYLGLSHDWTGEVGDWLMYEWHGPRTLREVRISFDSDLNRRIALTNLGPYARDVPTAPPATLVRAFRLEARRDGAWREVLTEHDNHQRFRRLPLDVTCDALRLVIERTWGADVVRLFRFEVD